MSKTDRWALPLLLSLALSSAAHADQLADIKARGTLTCGTVPNFEPFSFPDPKTRQTIGYDMDICEQVGKHLGVKTEVKTMSNDARIPELLGGRVDILTANVGYTPARAQQIEYSYQYYVSPHRLVVREDKGYDGLPDLAGKRISFIKGSTTEAFVRASVPTASHVNFEDAPTAFLAVIQGKADAFSASDLVGLRLAAKSEGQVRLKLISQSVGNEIWGIGVRKNERALLEAVNNALKTMEADGTASTIFERWLGPNTLFKKQREFKIAPIVN